MVNLKKFSINYGRRRYMKSIFISIIECFMWCRMEKIYNLLHACEKQKNKTEKADVKIIKKREQKN